MSASGNTMPGDHWRKKEWPLFDKIKTRLHLKKITHEELELIKRVAWDLSTLFSYHVLASSTVKSTRKDYANEVHAYILLHYPLTYRRLIYDHRVIDLACLYARRNFTPGILTKIPLEDLEKFETSVMLIEPYTLKNYPMVTFNKVLIYTAKQFYDSVAQENDAEITWNNWETVGIRLPFNASMLAWVSFDLPMWVVTHTPGKNEMFYEADFDDIEKQHAKEVILTKAYHQAQVDLAGNKKILDKTKRIAESYGRMLSNALKEAGRQQGKDFRAKINQIEKEKEEQRLLLTQKPNKIKQLIPLFIAIAIIIGAIIVLFMIFSFSGTLFPPTNSTAPVISVILNLLQVMF